MIVSKYIPFSYLWIHKHAIGEDVKTLLDVGCGNGQFMADLRHGENWKIIGVDIDSRSLLKARKTGVYDQLVKGDVFKVLSRLARKEKFDVVICSQLIEHLPRKRGEKLIELTEKLASKRIVLGTPRGYMEQPVKHKYNKKHQEHLSGWSIADFTKRGYAVRGVGFLPVWSYGGLGRSTRTISWVFRIVSLLVSPLVFFLPILGSGIVAYKRK